MTTRISSIICVLGIALLVWAASENHAVAQSDALGTTPPEQEEAIKAIRGWASNIQKNRDGTVRFIRFSKPRVTDEHLSHITVFKELDYLAVVTPAITDSGLANIKGLTNLDSLILSNTQASDATVAMLPQFTKLQTLYLDGTKISSESLKVIAGLPSLIYLSLSRTEIDDTDIELLAEIPTLESLHLKQTQVSDSVFAKLATFPTLKSIYLDDCRLTGSGANKLAGIKSLELLSMSGTDVTTNQLAEFTGLSQLKEIHFWRTEITDTAANDLTKQLATTQIRTTPAETQELSLFNKYLAGQPLNSVATSDAQPVVDANSKLTESVARRFRKPDGDTPDFQKHVVPLLGKLGCNGRACHGSFQGKGGFTLSMFGYDFKADHVALSDEDAGRILVDSPDDSLILQKPTETIEHGGGKRLEINSWQYNLLYRWIADGAVGTEVLNRVASLDVSPAEIVFTKPKSTFDLRVIVTWSDGSREDVTALARIEVLDDQIASVENGKTIHSVGSGDTHAVVTYDKSTVAVPIYRAVSNQTGNKYPEVDSPTVVDRLISDKHRKLGIVPADLCTDEEFIRRVTLDISGTLPHPQAIRDFLADTSPDKRRRKIDELLETNAYIDWWAMKLTDLTGSSNAQLGSTDMMMPSSRQWERWIRSRVETNTPWDEIAAGILLAESRDPGQDYNEYTWEQSSYHTPEHKQDFNATNNPMHYYWARGDIAQPTDKALSFGYIFLGVRLQCAQCHKHPFDQWSKNDFDQFTNFFRRIRWGTPPESQDARKNLMNRLGVPVKLDTAALRRQMYMRVAVEGLPIPWYEMYITPPGKSPMPSRILGGEEFDLNDFADPREPLFAWLVSKDNPYFARSFVNRFWEHYFGRGIVHPVDDFNAGNPPSNNELLDHLASQFIENGYDMKWLHREITNSMAYQRSWRTNDTNKNDKRHFSHSRLRRIQAEVLIDSIDQVTAQSARNTSFIEDTTKRNITLHPPTQSPQSIGYALAIFGKPTRSVNCDCERTVQPTLLQNIYVKNDREILEKIERKDGWLAEVARLTGIALQSETGNGMIVAANPNVDASTIPSDDQLINEAYLRTLSRSPEDHELKTAMAHLKSSSSKIEGLREVLWALINTQEFLTNH